MTHIIPFEFKCLLPPNAVPVFEESLGEIAGAVLTTPIEKGPNKGLWEIQAIFEQKPDNNLFNEILKRASKIANIPCPTEEITQMPDVNWLKESYQGFPPITIGRYYIYGSHIQENPPSDKIALKIDAATAFGTGEHQTTHGCLEALNHLNTAPKRVLDVGCGSGILSMAYAKTTGNKVDAVDIDPESVRVATENATNNNLSDLMTVWQSDGYADVQGEYDLVFCNILAKPLIQMAPDLYTHLAPGGIAILSGFLTRQERWVLKAHTDAGLKLINRYRINGWGTIVVQKDNVC